MCMGVRAQESASSGIAGQVLDTSKAGVPGATVTVTNVATNAQRVTQSDPEGRFTIPNLPPATYSVKIELSGFQTAELKDLTLRNGEIVRPILTLAVAGVSETVSVQSESPLLQRTNASVSQTITQKQIENLPVAGRNPLALRVAIGRRDAAGLQPRHTVRRGRQQPHQYVTVEGGRDSSTNYAIDGVYVRSLRFNNLSLNPPLDAVQEVSVLRNSFTTEYGQGQAVVSMVTKSGGEQCQRVRLRATGATMASTARISLARNPATRAQVGLHAAAAPSCRTDSSCLAATRACERRQSQTAARERAEPDAAVGRLLRLSTRDQAIRLRGSRFRATSFRRADSRNSQTRWRRRFPHRISPGRTTIKAIKNVQ